MKIHAIARAASPWIAAFALATTLGASPAVCAAPVDDFFKAVEMDRAGQVTDMIRNGWDINTPDAAGQSALFSAVKNESPKVFDVLMAQPGVKFDEANAVGETPLMMAALRGMLPAVQKLVARGAQINRSGWTPLHYAATGTSADTVKWLIGQGAAVDARSPNGSTPVMLAAKYGPEDSVFALVAGRADLTLRNERGMTAADFARSAGRESLGKRLDKLAKP